VSLLGKVLERLDGWYNPFTGFGSARDKVSSGYFVPELRLADQELSGLFHGDSIARRMVDLLPREMMRQGLNWAGPDADAFKLQAQSLALATHVLHAMVWSRLFGGGLLVLGADDGQPATAPLNEAAIRSFSFLKVYDRRRVSVATRNTQERDLFYGEPEVYRINRLDGGLSHVHRSRVIRLGGALTADEEKRAMDGWDYSVLQAPYNAMRKFQASYDSAGALMADASQGVFKMRGLISAIAQGGANGLRDLQTRAQLLDMSRSAAKAIMLDSDGETFERVATAFSGVPETLDRFANLLAAASEIPVTVLMGQAPAGLNATGDADTRSFYDRVRTEQENELRPILERLAHLISVANRLQTPALSFPSLWQETPGERADRRLKVAQRDVLYVENGIVAPEEVALSRFGDKAKDPDDLAIDPTLRVIATAKPVPAAPAPPQAPAALPPAPSPPPGRPAP
jgi:phage-related protein (TIGR01555 family)